MANVKEVMFISGGLQLRGWLHSPAHSPAAGVIISHGFGGYGDSPKWNFVAGGLARAGFPVLRFSHRGCGTSDGAFEDTTMTSRIEDLRAAMTMMAEEFGIRVFGLVGSSMGGAASLLCASDPCVKCAFLLAAPINLDFFSTMMRNKEPAVGGNIILDGLEVKPEFFRDAVTHDLEGAARRAKNLFIMHGECDPLISCDHAERIFSLTPEPRKLMIVPGADHPFTEERHQRIMLEQCIAWFQKHLTI